MDDLMADRVGEETPGATVAVVQGDRTLLAKGYGYADAKRKVPVRADETAFRVGSVGKLVTWTAVMQGVERGVLDLDTDVNDYLDDSAVEVPDAYGDPVTLGHLGTHTAGFESSLDPRIVADPGALRPLESLLAERRPRRIRPPGTAVGYSNYGAALAGHVVAETADATFEEYVQSEVFEPLDMATSTFAQPVSDDRPGELAAGHARSGGSFATPDPVYVNMYPAGSMTATATDMARFASAHLGDGAVGDDRILDADAARRMREDHHVRHPAVNNWRYGFYEYGAPDAGLIAHSGGTVYFKSLLVLAPDRNVGVFLDYNCDADESRLAGAVNAILDECGLRRSSPRPAPTRAAGRESRFEAVAGEYGPTLLPDSGPLNLMDLLARIVVEPGDEGRLVTRTLDGDPRKWIETRPYVFREVGGEDVLAFEVEDGEVQRLNVSSVPQGVHLPVPPHERRMATAGVLGGSLAGMGLSLLGRGVAGAWRRWRRSGDESEVEP